MTELFWRPIGGFFKDHGGTSREDVPTHRRPKKPEAQEKYADGKGTGNVLQQFRDIQKGYSSAVVGGLPVRQGREKIFEHFQLYCFLRCKGRGLRVRSGNSRFAENSGKEKEY